MYTWIAETFGVADGLARGLAFAIALGIVLILIALFVYILKRLTGTRLSAGRNRQPRIAVMDAANIDTRRRLLLIRRDNVEHLILVGGPSDIVVEQGIVKNSPLTANAPRPQTTMQGASGYTASTAISESPQADAAQTAALADISPSPAHVTPAAKPQAQAPRPTPAVPPEPSVRRPAQADTARRPATTPAYGQNRPEQSRPNPAKSLLQAAAAGRIAPTFGKEQTPQEPGAKPKGQPSGPPPLQAPGPVQAQRPGNPVQVNTPAKPAPSHPDAAVAGYTQDLAQVSAPSQMRQEPAQTPRQVTPPSSGPAARATTAFIKPATTNGATGSPEIQPGRPATPEPGEKEKSLHVEPAGKVPPTSSEPVPAVQLSSLAAPDVAPGNAVADTKAVGIEAIFADEPEAKASQVEDLTPPSGAGNDAKASTEAQTDKPEATPDTPNPIEDEMAKLLDEMHGSQKQ